MHGKHHMRAHRGFQGTWLLPVVETATAVIATGWCLTMVAPLLERHDDQQQIEVGSEKGQAMDKLVHCVALFWAKSSASHFFGDSKEVDCKATQLWRSHAHHNQHTLRIPKIRVIMKKWSFFFTSSTANESQCWLSSPSQEKSNKIPVFEIKRNWWSPKLKAGGPGVLPRKKFQI